MPNSFGQTVVANFNEYTDQYTENMTMLDLVTVREWDQKQNFYNGQQIWMPREIRATSTESLDLTGMFQGGTQLMIPIIVDSAQSSGFSATLSDLNNPVFLDKYAKAQFKQITQDISTRIHREIHRYAKNFRHFSTAPNAYDDLGYIQSYFESVGVTGFDNLIAIVDPSLRTTYARDPANRQNLTGDITTKAYRNAYISTVANVDIFSTQVLLNTEVASATGVTINGAQSWNPVPTDPMTRQLNYDSRFWYLSVTVTSGTIKVGDAFTVANAGVTINEVNYSTRLDTGYPFIFRVVEIVSGGGGSGVIRVASPAIFGTSEAEEQYQNVTAKLANGATVTFLNTARRKTNYVLHKDAIEFYVYEIPDYKSIPNSMYYHKSYGKKGLSFHITASSEIETLKTKVAIRTGFGINIVRPELIFGYTYQ